MKLIYCIFFALLSKTAFADNAQYIIEIKLENHVFTPSEIHIPKGKKFTLVINNLDETIEEFDSTHLNREKILRSKSKTNIVLAPLDTGRYDFVGEFHPDTAKGTVIVDE